jgi:hypothetical protein
MSKLGITSAIGWALAQPTGAGPSARLVLPKRFNPPVLVSASGNLRFVQTHRGITPGAPKIAGPVDPLLTEPEQAPRAFTRIRLDTYFGMGISNLVALAIIVTTAATLHANGMTDIQTSRQAAEALPRWQDGSRSSSSRSASSAPASWPSRCSPDRPLTQSARHGSGRSALARKPMEAKPSTAPWRSRRLSEQSSTSCPLTRSRPCTGAPSSTASWRRGVMGPLPLSVPLNRRLVGDGADGIGRLGTRRNRAGVGRCPCGRH